MNKNRKMKRKVAASVAVGMSVMMGVTPAFAASGTSDSDVYKEETVYVNAKASGKTDKVTVSNWLKNSGSVSGDLEDESTLSDIKNVKGDEEYTADGDKLTWSTDGEDIYYQGTTDKKLPVSVKLKYYLDGKQMKPSELKGKSGHLKITVDYKNNEKQNVSVDGKDTEVYTPFVMMTGMILPNETFSNVTIDNGKIISDGNKNIVVGFGMPGLKDSLNLSSEESDKVTIPESLSIEADVTDFTMSSTYTVALSDLLDDMDMDSIVNVDDLQTALDDLEDAALQLVSGSDTLADGAGTLADGVNSYTDGVDTLNAGIQKYLGSNGELSGSVTEYVNGVNKVVKGVQDYTDGVNTLADGVNGYVAGETKLATAVQQTLGSTNVEQLMAQVNAMVDTGNELLKETDNLSSGLANDIVAPIQTIAATLESMQTTLGTIDNVQNMLLKTCEGINGVVDADNAVINNAKTTASNSSKAIDNSINELSGKLAAIEDKQSEEAKAISSAIESLKAAKNATDGVAGMQGDLTKIDIAKMPAIDVKAIQANVNLITDNAEKLRKGTETLNTAVPDLKKKLNAIDESKGVLTQASGLMSSMNSLKAGFAELSSYNTSLVSGANKLKSSSPTLVAGVNTLQSGTNQLASGLNTLGSQMSSGSATLAANSSALRSGASELQSGAKELAEGMAKFDKEGTSKLKSTVEDELGDVLDRIEVLTSDDCKYNTFSGKDKAMDGNVKFVIETDAIE